ncbi:MAG: peptide-methionine (R)-S-oxide reductase MsrB [Rhodobacterales bacterium]|nr:peptide-methionine (R)-S-oxide reductase MsrB [Rhodobacterales bacterium]
MTKPLFKSLLSVAALLSLGACATTRAIEVETPKPTTARADTITKSDADWKTELTSEEYRVLRQAGTERPFTSELLKNHNDGTYTCAACGLELFEADAKFDSGTGWPSFFSSIGETHVTTKVDSSMGFSRTEILCARCDGHLGHVFDDGPEPTGLRYCVNGVSLDFEPLKR